MVVVIPAYQPDEKLLGVLRDFSEQTPFPIVVVDDGSSEDCRPIFDAVRGFERVTLLSHEVNRGKGAAMKTAFRYIGEHFPKGESVMTVDADGQHLIADALRVADRLKENPDALVLGSRKFTGNVPFKSRAGNAITRGVFRFCTGVRVYDTQTGLRAFSASRIPEMCALQGDRYEYEINQLVHCTKNHIDIVEERIDTVYIEGNKSSHFHAVKDSFRIYKVLLSSSSIMRFIGVSILSFLIDAAIFYGMLWLLSGFSMSDNVQVLIARIVSRTVSSVCNYMMNRYWVFDAKNARMSFPKYVLLALAILGISYGIDLLAMWIGISKWVLYVPVQVVVYPLSYVLQRAFVFHDRRNSEA